VVPDSYIEKFDDLSKGQQYLIKSKYKNKPVIYLWQNKINGRCYVGSSKNLFNRLSNYFDNYYLNKVKDKMIICSALLRYGHTNFILYVLEVLPHDDIPKILYREDYFVKLVKPSYNIAAVLNPFVGENHPRFGKEVLPEQRAKTSQTLKGRVRTQEVIENHRKGAQALKKIIYCYDFHTKEFVVDFESIRGMSRVLDVHQLSIQRKVDNNKPFNCFYLGNPQTWILSSKQLS
jgi:hypothetical protein